MTKLSDLKVGDKFRGAGGRPFSDDVYELVAAREFDGVMQFSVWSDVADGFDIAFKDLEVIPIREPQYRPYSDLRVLRTRDGGYVKDKESGDELHACQFFRTGDKWRVRFYEGISHDVDAQYLFENYTHLDGTPCGELVQ